MEYNCVNVGSLRYFFFTRERDSLRKSENLNKRDRVERERERERERESESERFGVYSVLCMRSYNDLIFYWVSYTKKPVLPVSDRMHGCPKKRFKAKNDKIRKWRW